jgi:hypothetical protein
MSIDLFIFRTSIKETTLPSPTCANDGPLTDKEISLLPPTADVKNFICRTRTNSKGEYTIDNIPVGSYIIVSLSQFYSIAHLIDIQLPIYSTTSLQITFVPEQKLFTVTHKDLNLETPFETGTVSFYGRVVKSNTPV